MENVTINGGPKSEGLGLEKSDDAPRLGLLGDDPGAVAADEKAMHFVCVAGWPS